MDMAINKSFSYKLFLDDKSPIIVVLGQMLELVKLLY